MICSNVLASVLKKKVHAKPVDRSTVLYLALNE